MKVPRVVGAIEKRRVVTEVIYDTSKRLQLVPSCMETFDENNTRFTLFVTVNSLRWRWGHWAGLAQAN